MSTAILSLARHQARQLLERFRTRAHQAVDDMLDRLEARITAPEAAPPRLVDLAEAVFQERSAFTGALVEALVEHRYGELLTQQEALCPGCQRRLRVHDEARTRTVDTLVGSVRLRRPYFYCPVCQDGFAPLDEALGLSPRVKQWDVQHAGAKLALEMPHQRAATLLRELTDMSMSDCTIHDVVQEVGHLQVLQVCPSAEHIRTQIATAAEGRKWKPIVVLAIDAANVPCRPDSARGTRPGRKKSRAHRRPWKGDYHQAKGFRFYLVDDDRIVQLISWHQIYDEDDFGAALRQVQEAGLIPEDQVRLCAVGDGAPWIWKWVTQLFPSARQILDYYHCSGYLSDVAAAQYGDDPAQATHWLEAATARLFCGEADGVVWGLQRMKPASDQAQDAIDSALSYLGKRLHQIDYASHRKGGYPIGSGGIESAHRFIGHVRLKRSGAWWYRENSNAILALRCALYNGTLERVFQIHQGNSPPPPAPTNG